MVSKRLGNSKSVPAGPSPSVMANAALASQLQLKHSAAQAPTPAICRNRALLLVSPSKVSTPATSPS